MTRRDPPQDARVPRPNSERCSTKASATYLGLPWLALSLLVLTGCSDALDRLLGVDAPGLVIASDLDDPAHAELLVEGVIADFDCAFSHYAVAGGLVGWELTDPQNTAAQWAFDRRTFVPSGGWYATSTCAARLGVYVPLSTARWAADNALRSLEEWSDSDVADRSRLIAKAAAYSGYSHVLMGEGFCSAAFDSGPEMSREEVFERAVERFTRAIEAATSADDASVLNMARVGRARALLNLGRPDQAALDAERVPEGFVRHASFSAASYRSANRVYRMTIRDVQASVYEAFWDLEVDGVPDPRVSLVHTGTLGPNSRTPLVNQTKYLAENSPMPIARWAEAQLILAEADGGQGAVEVINRLRDQAELPHFESSDPAEIRAQIIEERSRELFLESHHLGDLIRYDLPLDPAPGEPYPMGGFYGEQKCFPLPDVERDNNPNIP